MMKIIKFVSFLAIINMTLVSCGAFSDAGKVLRNEKQTADEFLVKKKEPLTQPPGFDEIPKPGSIKGEKNKDLKNIEDILSVTKEENESSKSLNSSTETSILNQIKK